MFVGRFRGGSPKKTRQDFRNSGESAEGESSSSPVFDAFMGRLKAGERKNLLDLGGFSTNNANLFARFPCRLYLPDFYASWEMRCAALPDPEEEETGRAADFEAVCMALFADIFGFDEQTRLDLVLAWDLLNYMERDLLALFSAFLARFCHAETRLFALFHSRAAIPARPMQCAIQDDESVVYRVDSPIDRPFSPYTARELGRLMPHFVADRSVLLRSGLRETLFAKNERPAAPA